MKPLILNAAESGASGSQTTGGYGSDSTAALLLERAQRNHRDPGLTLGGVLAAVAAPFQTQAPQVRSPDSIPLLKSSGNFAAAPACVGQQPPQLPVNTYQTAGPPEDVGGLAGSILPLQQTAPPGVSLRSCVLFRSGTRVSWQRCCVARVVVSLSLHCRWTAARTFISKLCKNSD